LRRGLRNLILGSGHSLSLISDFLFRIQDLPGSMKSDGMLAQIHCELLSASKTMTRATVLRVFAITLFGLSAFAKAADPIRVLVWDERQPEQKKAYDGGFLGNAIADYLKKQPGLEVKSVGLDDPEQGLSKDTLDKTDVIVWWGHV